MQVYAVIAPGTISSDFPAFIFIVGVISRRIQNPDPGRPRPSSHLFLLSDLFFNEDSDWAFSRRLES